MNNNIIVTRKVGQNHDYIEKRGWGLIRSVKILLYFIIATGYSTTYFNIYTLYGRW